MGPLTGVRVLDLSRMLPMGAISQLLADLGADVVKIERPGTGEETRQFGEPVGGTTAAHAFIDRGKRSVAVDLKNPHGITVVRELCRNSDILLESFRPGVADRLGLGWQDLQPVNPQLVYCSVNGYGTGGPRDAEPGHDLNYLAYAGAMNFGGSRAHGPQLSGIQTSDLIGGLVGGVGLLAALVAVRSGGPGTRVEVALADAALWAMGLHASSFLAGDTADGPESTVVTGAVPCYRVYTCSDGRYLSIAAIEPQFWAEVVQVLGRPDLLTRHHDPAAIEVLAEIIGGAPLADWVHRFRGRDSCVAPVQNLAEVAADPQFRARGMIVPVPGHPAVDQVGTPITVSDGLTPVRPAAAVVGADTHQVLAELDLDPAVLASVQQWAPAIDAGPKTSTEMGEHVRR